MVKKLENRKGSRESAFDCMQEKAITCGRLCISHHRGQELSGERREGEMKEDGRQEERKAG